jgi:hypothetical protein
MATRIIHRRGRGVPDASEFASVGEILIDTSAGTAYTLNDSDAVVALGGGSDGGSGAGMVIQPDEPADPETGLQWLESTTGKVWLWDDDKWLEFPAATPDVSPVIVSEDEPEGSIGQLWYKPSEGAMYVHDGNGWQAFGSGGDGGNGGNGGDGNAELHSEDGVLVIAGGGSGGGNYAGGGGGAGGWQWEPMVFEGGRDFQINVGGGGPASTNIGANGSSSYILETTSGAQFLQSQGGGKGGTLDSTGGSSGGSGGGTSYRPSNSPGRGEPGQGFGGGEKSVSGVGSGGGGASEAGESAATGIAGKGGDGAMSDITGEAVIYAGGGPGGNQPGYGGPPQSSTGGGAFDSAGEDGKGAGGAGTNTGGTPGYAGGDGVIIVRTTAKPHTVSGDPEIIEDGAQTVYVFGNVGELKF